VEEAETHLSEIDIAVLDYHLGAGKFGTEVAQSLAISVLRFPSLSFRHAGTKVRRRGRHAPAQGYSSVDDLLGALRSFEAKRAASRLLWMRRDFSIPALPWPWAMILSGNPGPRWRLAVCK